MEKIEAKKKVASKRGRTSKYEKIYNEMQNSVIGHKVTLPSELVENIQFFETAMNRRKISYQIIENNGVFHAQKLWVPIKVLISVINIFSNIIEDLSVEIIFERQFTF